MDRRVIRTKRAIRNSLALLLNEKEINDITIKEIAERADINRKTFYNYYSGIHEIIEEIENEVVSKVGELLKDINFRESMNNPYSIFQKINNVILSDFDFYSHLLSITENHTFTQKITQMLKNKIKETLFLQTSLNDSQIKVVLDYSVSGIISVYQNWFNSDRKESIEEISKTVSSLFYFGFNKLINNQK